MGNSLIHDRRCLPCLWFLAVQSVQRQNHRSREPEKGMTIESQRREGEEESLGGGGGDEIIVIPQSRMAEEGSGEPLLLKRSENEKGSIAVMLLSVGVAVLGAFVFGTCVGFSAPSQSEMMKDLDLSLSQYSTFGSILNIGAMFGATTSGYIADFSGRKGAMRISSIFCLLGWLSIYYSQGIVMLCVGRLSTRWGIGVFSYVVPVYVAEISPKDLRGGLTTLNQVSPVGLLFSYIPATMSVSGMFFKWRMLTLVGAIPCVALLIGLIFIPESPRWLAMFGDEDRLEASLQRLRGYDADVTQEAKEINDYIYSIVGLPKACFTDMFSKRRYMHSVTVGVGLMIFQQFSGVGGIGFYASQLFVDAGFHSGSIGTAILGSSQIPITLLGALLMDRSGRKPLLIVSATGTLVGMLIATFSFLFKEQGLESHWIPIAALAGILIYAGSFSIGMAATPWVIMSEIFPPDMKKIGGSFVTLVNWFGSWATTYSFNFLLNWSLSGTFFAYSIVCAASILFIAKAVPETKGKTLEEIQHSLYH